MIIFVFVLIVIFLGISRLIKARLAAARASLSVAMLNKQRNQQQIEDLQRKIAAERQLLAKAESQFQGDLDNISSCQE